MEFQSEDPPQFRQEQGAPELDTRIGSNTAKERREYAGHLQEVVTGLNEQLGPEGWWMVGSNSREARIGPSEDSWVLYPDNAWRDVDIIVRQDKKKDLERFRSEYDGPLEVGGGVFQTNIDIREDSVALVFGRIREEVPIETFDNVQADLEGVTFPTVPLNTLLHIYVAGEKRMRPKDFGNALSIARYLKEHPEPDYPEELYEGFHNYSYRRNNTNEADVMNKIRSLGVRYSNSQLNNVVPINSPRMRKVVEHVWQIMGDVDMALGNIGQMFKKEHTHGKDS